MWSYRFNDGFAHLLYGDGQEMCKKMKSNISLNRLRVHLALRFQIPKAQF
jgi:hypothetical protein